MRGGYVGVQTITRSNGAHANLVQVDVGKFSETSCKQIQRISAQRHGGSALASSRGKSPGADQWGMLGST
jgi:hypothetical protein